MTDKKKNKQAINKVCVIGSGVMGAGIAAQVANAGTEVLLLDIVPKDAKDRNVVAKGAVAALKKSNPAALMHPRNAKLIEVGNLEDDLKKLKECDWIVEVIVERLDIKQDLYKKIEKHAKKDAIVSSNTSTLPLSQLTDGMSDAFKKRFLITHFFNPPRYLRLLEVVTAKETDKKLVKLVKEFADVHLGKSIVDCNDTPGFIANRIGTFWLQKAVVTAFTQKVGVEEADAVLSRPAGVPRTGVFGLIDLVGLDLMPHILKSLGDTLDREDEFHKVRTTPELLTKMIEDGYTGRKGKGGFYKLNKQRKKEVIDLQTGEYSLAKRPKPKALKRFQDCGLRDMLKHDSKEAKYAWDVLSATLAYSADLVGEIAGSIEEIDRGMKLGYNWKLGPFELIDKIGSGWFAEKLMAEGRKVPKILKVADGRKFYREHEGKLQFLDVRGEYKDVPRPKGVLLLSDIKRNSKPVLSNISASVWDIGDGVACLEFHSKMNSLNLFSLSMIEKTTKELPKLGFKALVVHNEGTNFSVGAFLPMLLVAAFLRFGPAIRYILRKGQFALNDMKKAPFPVVGAPSGMALGGGCEVLLHCNAVVPHAETYVGLVEAGVGIIPGWGGCKEILGRAGASDKIKKGPMPRVMHTFETIGMAKVAKSADEAKSMHFFKADDEVVMNKDRVLFEAKKKAIAMAKNFEAPEPYEFNLPGAGGATALTMGVQDFVKRGLVTKHDQVVVKELINTITGGKADVTDTLTEEDILKLERDSIVKLCKTKGTRDRIVHMLKKGKPLRN